MTFFFLSKQLFCSCKCLVNVFAEVFFADFLIHSALFEHLHRLSVNVRHNQCRAVLLAGFDKRFKAVDACCIDCRHASHTQDKNLFIGAFDNIGNLVGNAEENRTCDFKDHCASGICLRLMLFSSVDSSNSFQP